MHWKQRSNKIVIESDGFTYWLFLLSWAVSVLCTGYLLHRWKWCIEAALFHHLIFKCDLCAPIIAFYWTFCFEQRRIFCRFSCSFLRIDYWLFFFPFISFLSFCLLVVRHSFFFFSLLFFERSPNTKRSECAACIWNKRLYSFSDVPTKYLVHSAILIFINKKEVQHRKNKTVLQWTKMRRTTIAKWCFK